MTGKPRTCTSPGCTRTAVARRLCRAHYQAAWKAGELGAHATKPPTYAAPGLCPPEHRHGEPERAFGLMQHAVIESIESELQFETATRPDRTCDGDSPEDTAVYTLASLLNTYNVHHAGTFVKASRLLVDAYPALVPALVSIEGTDHDDHT